MVGSMFRDALTRFLDSPASRTFQPGRRLGPREAHLHRARRPADQLRQGPGQRHPGLHPRGDPASRSRPSPRARGLRPAEGGARRGPDDRGAGSRNADTLIGGFMKLIGQEEIWRTSRRRTRSTRALGVVPDRARRAAGVRPRDPGAIVYTLCSHRDHGPRAAVTGLFARWGAPSAASSATSSAGPAAQV